MLQVCLTLSLWMTWGSTSWQAQWATYTPWNRGQAHPKFFQRYWVNKVKLKFTAIYTITIQKYIKKWNFAFNTPSNVFCEITRRLWVSTSWPGSGGGCTGGLRRLEVLDAEEVVCAPKDALIPPLLIPLLSVTSTRMVITPNVWTIENFKQLVKIFLMSD